MADSGLRDLERRIMAMADGARREIAAAVDRSADELVDAAKHLAPVDDGDLRDSVRKEPGPTALARVVTAGGPTTTRTVREGSGVDYDYALAAEFGTSETPAQPFFWPAYRSFQKRFRSRIDRATRKAAKAAGWQA